MFVLFLSYVCTSLSCNYFFIINMQIETILINSYIYSLIQVIAPGDSSFSHSHDMFCDSASNLSLLNVITDHSVGKMKEFTSDF